MKTSDLDSICAVKKQRHIHEFCGWCCEQLGINVPDLNLAPKNDTTALGYTNMKDGSVTIVVADRHQMDIMRTLAHELVHCKQMTTHTPCGDTGSKDENEANALAGVLMREWGQQNPDLYTEGKNMREDSRTVSNYNPDGKTYKGKRMPSLDDDDLNNMAQDIDSFDDNEFAYDHDMDKSIDDDNRNKKIADILKGLDPREQKIIKMRYVDGMSLGQVAKEFELSTTRIQHIEQKALRKLRHPTRSDQLAPYAEAKKEMSAQDRFNKRLKDKHGIDLEDREKFYADMKKKFQQSLDSKKESTEDLEESKAAKIMALITALGATYGLEDEARAFADQIKQNIHNAQNAEPNPGKPDPVLPGNMVKVPGGNMDRPMDEKAPPGREKQVKKLKKKFDDSSAPYAIAWAQHNKHGKPQKEQRILEIKKRQMEIRQQIRDLEEAKKDACYHKVKSRYKVWPSAYASGALVKCRKKGAKNWGNKSKK